MMAPLTFATTLLMENSLDLLIFYSVDLGIFFVDVQVTFYEDESFFERFCFDTLLFFIRKTNVIMQENTRESAKNHIFESPTTFLTRVNGILELGNRNPSKNS